MTGKANQAWCRAASTFCTVVYASLDLSKYRAEARCSKFTAACKERTAMVGRLADVGAAVALSLLLQAKV
jgi:hypothetical protein